MKQKARMKGPSVVVATIVGFLSTALVSSPDSQLQLKALGSTRAQVEPNLTPSTLWDVRYLPSDFGGVAPSLNHGWQPLNLGTSTPIFLPRGPLDACELPEGRH